MKTNANEGSNKVYVTMAITIIILVILGAVLWWYDIEWANHRHVVGTFKQLMTTSIFPE